VDHAPIDPVLAMMPEVDARAVLGSRTLAFRVLRPPYPALGIGTLRVLRVAERDGKTELVVGYDGYERMGSRQRPSSDR
jgi:hypothetical protein